MSAAVIIPIKSFDLAKGRLATRLSPAERAALAKNMATTVIAAAHDLVVYVVCDDAEVAAFAIAQDANVVWRPARGLNGAVEDGREAAAADGHDRIIVAHGDLPKARDLTWLADATGVLIVTDRRSDGTNVMSLPVDPAFGFAYGSGSADLHRTESERLSWPVEIVHDDDLGWDIDVPEDLVVFENL